MLPLHRDAERPLVPGVLDVVAVVVVVSYCLAKSHRGTQESNAAKTKGTVEIRKEYKSARGGGRGGKRGRGEAKP